MLSAFLHRRRRRGRGWSRCLAVDQILEFLARLEERNLLRRDFNAIASLWVAADAGLTLTSTEAAETPDLDFVARPQRAHDALEDGFDDDLAVFAGQFRQPGHLVDQVRLCHSFSPRQLLATS